MAFLFERLYSLFLTFFVSYFIYGSLFILYLWCKSPLFCQVSNCLTATSVIGWFLALVVAGIITFSLYNEMVFHGMAFVTIEEVLLKLFKTSNYARGWSRYQVATDEIQEEKDEEETKSNSEQAPCEEENLVTRVCSTIQNWLKKKGR